MQRPSPLKLNRLSLPGPEAVRQSPTLARVQRITLKLEEPQLFTSTTDDEDEDRGGSEKCESPRQENANLVTLLKGPLLTVSQGPFLKKWKMRYFLLTRDFLSCFKYDKNGLTTMGNFLFKLRLAEIIHVQWINSRKDAMGTVHLELGPVLVSPVDEVSPLNYQQSNSNNKRNPILMRSPIGVKDAVLYEWFEAIEEHVEASKQRRATRSASFGSRELPKMKKLALTDQSDV